MRRNPWLVFAGVAGAWLLFALSDFAIDWAGATTRGKKFDLINTAIWGIGWILRIGGTYGVRALVSRFSIECPASAPRPVGETQSRGGPAFPRFCRPPDMLECLDACIATACRTRPARRVSAPARRRRRRAGDPRSATRRSSSTSRTTRGRDRSLTAPTPSTSGTAPPPGPQVRAGTVSCHTSVRNGAAGRPSPFSSESTGFASHA